MAFVTADTSNHINAFTYDGGGNALSDGSYSYAWDGDNRMKSAAGVNYTYDAFGLVARVPLGRAPGSRRVFSLCGVNPGQRVAAAVTSPLVSNS